jgi:hypothetical protein
MPGLEPQRRAQEGHPFAVKSSMNCQCSYTEFGVDLLLTGKSNDMYHDMCPCAPRDLHLLSWAFIHLCASPA